MATGVIYLDSDDEITSAAARIRSVDGRRAAVVLPYGSRVATSRINFRLLARDALTHEKRLSVIAADAGTRALAASAGLPVFANVGEYEAALAAEEAPPDRPLEQSATVVAPPKPIVAPPTRVDRVDRSGPDGGTLVETVDPTTLTAPIPVPARRPSVRDTGTARPAAGAPVADASPPGRAPSVARSGGRGIGRDLRRRAIVLALAITALAVVVGGVAAYLFLPSATAVVTPREESIGPVSLRVSASTRIDTPDVTAGLVPAKVVSVEVQAQATFPATGKRVEETKAIGAVRFDNLDPTASNTIAKGSIVSAAGGIRFRTDTKVTIPAARLVGFRIFPSQATVKVTAVGAGPDGNVEANTILTVPRGEEPLFLKVTNPDPTSGGARKEFPRVAQEDVDAALAALAAQLRTAFTDRLDDPDLGAADVTVFAETAKLGPAVPSVAPDTLVGKELTSFDLGASATGTVTTVDAAPVRVIAEARLDALVDAGHRLVDGSSEITEAPAVVEGETITYPVVATARQVAVLDPADLEALILGKPLDEARAILGAYGDATVEVWPDWVATIPTIDSRVEVTVSMPVSAENPDETTAPPGAP